MRLSSLSALVLLGLTPVLARAVPTTFTYTGVITQKQTGVTGFAAPWNNPAIVVGTPMSLSYTFESTTPDGNASPNTGYYQNTISQIALTIGPASATVNYVVNQPSILIYNDFVFPTFTTDRHGFFATGFGGNSDLLTTQWDDTTFSAFASDALPLTQPNLAAFTNQYGSFTSLGLFNSEYNFRLDPIPRLPGGNGPDGRRHAPPASLTCTALVVKQQDGHNQATTGSHSRTPSAARPMCADLPRHNETRCKR